MARRVPRSAVWRGARRPEASPEGALTDSVMSIFWRGGWTTPAPRSMRVGHGAELSSHSE